MKKNRGVLTVAAGAFIMLMLGAAYVWGVYKQPLADYFGWTKAAAAIPFSVFLACYTAGMIVGGKLYDNYGPKNVCTAGAALFGTGYFASGFAANLWQLTGTYGMVAGFGAGLSYVTPVAAAAKWFPSKKGLVSGIIIFGFGAGAFLLAPAAGWLIANAGWRSTFKILGGFFLAAATLASRFVDAPDYQTVGEAADLGLRFIIPRAVFESSPSELFRNPVFYASWSVWFLCLSAGLGTMGHLVAHATKSGIGQMRAAMILSVIAAFNGAGRIILGALSDKIGRIRVFAGAAATMAAVSFGFSIVHADAGGGAALYALGALFGLSFGSLLVLYPTIAADFFGTKHLGANYGILFSSYGLAGIAGPVIYGRLFDITGTYAAAFAAGGAGSAAALITALWLGKKIGFSPR
ncbi:MAG: OFA family MFS transporter [Endomicrobiia bacterium]|nr:OFA family MFS transporter [Endomicrobiia bacterium]